MCIYELEIKLYSISINAFSHISRFPVASIYTRDAVDYRCKQMLGGDADSHVYTSFTMGALCCCGCE